MNRSNLENSFEFVVIAGARARQLMRGALPRVESTDKPIKVAQQEVAEKKVEKIDERRGDRRLVDKSPNPQNTKS